MFHNHLSTDKSCACGGEIEDVEHFLFTCPLYVNQQLQLFHSLRQFHPLNCGKLIFGEESFTDEQNVYIFEKVFKYISDTKRFNIT